MSQGQRTAHNIHPSARGGRLATAAWSGADLLLCGRWVGVVGVLVLSGYTQDVSSGTAAAAKAKLDIRLAHRAYNHRAKTMAIDRIREAKRRVRVAQKDQGKLLKVGRHQPLTHNRGCGRALPESGLWWGGRV